jgi:molybdopterin-containing oxidoreductase family molybdopterin binding subunit
MLRGKDIGEKKINAFIIWDKVSNSPKVLRRSTLKTASIKGEYEINGIKCKTALQLLIDLSKLYPPDKTAEITGVTPYLITKLGEKIGKSGKVTFFTWMGFTRTYHGDISLRGLVSVATITGNVTTSFSSGYIPAVLNWDPFLKAIPDKPSFHRIGILNLYNAVISGKPYPIRGLWFAFINFLNQCVDCNKIISKFFPKLDFIVQTELFMTPTAKYADILLPVCTFLEFSDFLPQPDPYLQLQRKVIEPLYESKSDVDIVAGLADKLGFREFFKGGELAMIDLIMDHPSLEQYTREKLNNNAMLLRKLPDGSNIPLSFSTPSGKIELYAEQLVQDDQALPVYLPPIEAPISRPTGKYPISYIQGHSRFRTHSMFANIQRLLNINPEPVVDINSVDALKRGIDNGDLVTLFNDRGKTTLKARISEAIGPEVVDITEGWWISQFLEGSVNHLTHDIVNPVQDKVYEPNMHMNDVAVEVTKFEEVK